MSRLCNVTRLKGEAQPIENESAPIQSAQCRFSGLAISNAKILIFISNEIYGSNFIQQHSETVMLWTYRNTDCSLEKKIIVSFIIIFGTLSFRSSTEGAALDAINMSSRFCNSFMTYHFALRFNKRASRWAESSIAYSYCRDSIGKRKTTALMRNARRGLYKLSGTYFQFWRVRWLTLSSANCAHTLLLLLLLHYVIVHRV